MAGFRLWAWDPRSVGLEQYQHSAVWRASSRMDGFYGGTMTLYFGIWARPKANAIGASFVTLDPKEPSNRKSALASGMAEMPGIMLPQTSTTLKNFRLPSVSQLANLRRGCAGAGLENFCQICTCFQLLRCSIVAAWQQPRKNIRR